MSGFIDPLLNAPAPVVLGAVGLLVFAEDALFVGFVLPGETAAILGGVAASRGHVALSAVLAVVLLAAVIGDSVGYEIGRKIGPRVLDLTILDRHRKRLDEARDFLARRGGTVVFLGRWVAFFRAVMPTLAGTARMPYPKFLAFNVAGGLAWGTTVVLTGYLAGQSFTRIEKTLGRGAAVVALVILGVILLVWRVRKHRAEKTREQDASV